MLAKLRSVQVLRAVAACAVVAHHAYGATHPGTMLKQGAAGVDLFFVISGFIMVHVSRGKGAGEFLKDRAWRIYPMWWIALLPWLLMFTPHSLLGNLSLWPVYGGGFNVPVLGVGWTLSFEMMFYVAFAVALATRPAVPLAAYAVLFVFALVTNDALVSYLGSPMALEFLMGVAVAHLPIARRYAFALPIGFALFAVTSPALNTIQTVINPQTAFVRAAQWGVPGALVLWGALSAESFFSSKAWELPVVLGDGSYSIYLFHTLVVYALNVDWLARMFLAVAFGLAMHVLIERRLLALRLNAKTRDGRVALYSRLR